MARTKVRARLCARGTNRQAILLRERNRRIVQLGARERGPDLGAGGAARGGTQPEPRAVVDAHGLVLQT